MGVVNADSSAIIETWQNIKNAIGSVETTRASINRKYQQLGNDWSDKKYRDLGDTIQDCNKALSSILKTLQQGDTFLSALWKALLEYESVNLYGGADSDNAFVQQLRNTANGSSSNNTYQYCLGVLTCGVLPTGYTGVLFQRHESAEPVARSVFDHFSNQLQIRNANYPPEETAHYSPNNYPDHPRGVYYNANADSTNLRGAGTTYYHELGHMIDHAATGYNGCLSNTPEFGNALIEDGQRVLNLYNNLTPERQTAFLNRIRQDSMHSFSDLIDATTQGQLHGQYGHSREYWGRSGNLQAEAFAHFFEASMGSTEKLEMLANFFPTAFGVFSSMLESIQPDTMVRVLERSR